MLKKILEFDVYICINKECRNNDSVKCYDCEKDTPKCKNCGKNMSWIGCGIEI